MTSTVNLQDYQAFLEKKISLSKDAGMACSLDEIHPLLKPHQAAIVQWAVQGGRRAIFASFGCVAGETIIQGPEVNERIDRLAEAGLPITVWALGDSGPVKAIATAPFYKGVADLFEFVLASGRRITTTLRHRFLTPAGWRVAASLRVGDAIAVSSPAFQQTEAYASELSGQHSSSFSPRPTLDREVYGLPQEVYACLPLSSSGRGLLVRAVDARNSWQTTEDSQADYSACLHQDGGQLRLSQGIGLSLLPSQDDVLARSRSWILWPT